MSRISVVIDKFVLSLFNSFTLASRALFSSQRSVSSSSLLRSQDVSYKPTRFIFSLFQWIYLALFLLMFLVIAMITNVAAKAYSVIYGAIVLVISPIVFIISLPYVYVTMLYSLSGYKKAPKSCDYKESVRFLGKEYVILSNK